MKKNTKCEVYKGVSKTSLAVKYNLSAGGIIVLWMKKYDELGYNGLTNKRGRPKNIMSPNETNKETNEISNSTLTNEERKELEQLKERNKQLEMELDLLKKLNALVQQRNKQQKKKK